MSYFHYRHLSTAFLAFFTLKSFEERQRRKGHAYIEKKKKRRDIQVVGSDLTVAFRIFTTLVFSLFLHFQKEKKSRRAEEAGAEALRVDIFNTVY